MLIVCSKEGQLCNRLYHFSHIVSFALENNEIIWYPYIDEYSHIFKNLRANKLRKNNIFIYTTPLLQWILRIIRGLLIRMPNNRLIIWNGSEIEVNLNSYRSRGVRLVFLNGWLLRDKASFSKNHTYIKQIFQFNDNVVKICNDNIKKIRKFNILLIGIHIRRGDYESFQGGRYYYNLNVYIEIMQQLRNLYKNEKNVHFLIVTNDYNFVSSHIISGPDITHNNGNEESDLYSLSQCDLIVGPPSTFSGWASFYGYVPLLHIVEQNQIINKSDFKVNEC